MAKKSSGGFLSSLYKTKTYLAYFVLLRFYVGAVMLYTGWQKFTGGWLNPDGSPPLKRVLEMWISGKGLAAGHAMPHHWYYDFLTQYVLPNAHLIGVLVTVGELAAGALLAIGLANRLAGLLVAFMTFNYLMATQHIGLVFQLENSSFILAGILIMLSAPGRAMGIDWFLYRAFPKSILW